MLLELKQMNLTAGGGLKNPPCEARIWNVLIFSDKNIKKVKNRLQKIGIT